MPEFLELFGEVTIAQIVTMIIAIGAISGLILKYNSKFDSWYEKRKHNKKVLTEFDETIRSLSQKQEQDMVRSNQMDLDIKKELEKLVEKINVISQMLLESNQNTDKRFEEMQEKMDVSERLKLKDRISQVYRYHHAKGEWTTMDKESFHGLILDYENHGGQNSFIHEICEPESCTWKIIDVKEED